MAPAVDEKNQPLWRQEMKWRNLGFGHKNPCLFVEPQCGNPSVLYIAWRLLAALFFTSVLIYGAAIWEHGIKWFIFISNWTYMLLVLHSILHLVCAVYHYRKYRRMRKEVESPYPAMPGLWQFNWILYTLLLVTLPMVAIGYWVVIFDGQWDLSLYNVTSHGIAAGYIFLELWFGGGPVRVLHFYVPVVYGLIYALFTYLYYIGGGTDIFGNRVMYRYLDYDLYPNYALMIIVSMIILSLVVHLLIFSLFRFKRSMHKRFCCSPCQGYHNQYPVDRQGDEYAYPDDPANNDPTKEGNMVQPQDPPVRTISSGQPMGPVGGVSGVGGANVGGVPAGMGGVYGMGGANVGGVSGGRPVASIPMGTVSGITLAPVGTMNSGQGARIILAPTRTVNPGQAGGIQFASVGGADQRMGGVSQPMGGVSQPMGGVSQAMGVVSAPMGGSARVPQYSGGVNQPMGGVRQPVVGSVSQPVINVGGAYGSNPSLGPGDTYRYSTNVGRPIPFMISQDKR